jgi:hypothetical protein
MINYYLILTTKYPNTEWTLDGFEYSGLTWLDQSTKPSKAELDALWESTQAEVAAKEQSKNDVKQSALSKLSALGLTQEEINSLIGTM